MGLVSDPSGISVQLYGADNKPSEDPLFGKFTYLHSVKQSDVTSRRPMTAAETRYDGSDDWLTVVAVADTQAKLDAIVPKAKRVPSAVLSSCASHRVMVHVHVGGRKETFASRTVIASGPVVLKGRKQPEVRVVHVKVFDPKVPMDGSHPMINEFDGWASMLNTMRV